MQASSASTSGAADGRAVCGLPYADPSAPQQLVSQATSETCDLTVRGSYAYFVDGADFGDGGLRVVDVSDPTVPALGGQETVCPYASGIDVSAGGNSAYIACASDANGANELRIIDTTDRSNPTLIGSITLPEASSCPTTTARIR